MLKKICRHGAVDVAAAILMIALVFWPVAVMSTDFLFYAFTDKTLTDSNWATYVVMVVYIPVVAKVVDPFVQRYIAWVRSP